MLMGTHAAVTAAATCRNIAIPGLISLINRQSRCNRGLFAPSGWPSHAYQLSHLPARQDLSGDAASSRFCHQSKRPDAVTSIAGAPISASERGAVRRTGGYVGAFLIGSAKDQYAWVPAWVLVAARSTRGDGGDAGDATPDVSGDGGGGGGGHGGNRRGGGGGRDGGSEEEEEGDGSSKEPSNPSPWLFLLLAATAATAIAILLRPSSPLPASTPPPPPASRPPPPNPPPPPPHPSPPPPNPPHPSRSPRSPLPHINAVPPSKPLFPHTGAPGPIPSSGNSHRYISINTHESGTQSLFTPPEPTKESGR
ncbi:unnamed protein product [Closterium sp. NIES-64]|nr:unnamed protein product [Closterium sp. NIES-64]